MSRTFDPAYLGIIRRNSKMSKTMKAVVFNGPLDVSLEDRPVPQIKDQTDIIVKVKYSALCGR